MNQFFEKITSIQDWRGKERRHQFPASWSWRTAQARLHARIWQVRRKKPTVWETPAPNHHHANSSRTVKEVGSVIKLPLPLPPHESPASHGATGELYPNIQRMKTNFQQAPLEIKSGHILIHLTNPVLPSYQSQTKTVKTRISPQPVDTEILNEM